MQCTFLNNNNKVLFPVVHAPSPYLLNITNTSPQVRTQKHICTCMYTHVHIQTTFRGSKEQEGCVQHQIKWKVSYLLITIKLVVMYSNYYCFLFYRWCSWGSKKLHMCIKLIQIINGRVKTWTTISWIKTQYPLP